MGPHPTRVLLIEDEEADYLLTRRMLASIENREFDLSWADSWQAGIEAIRRCNHEVCLLDFRIGGGDGLELLKESRQIGCQAPVILLTGLSDHRLDLDAMRLGAADFLVKHKLTPELLERSIRYAMTQAEAMQELQRRQDEIRAAELRFRCVVQSAGDAIVISDENGKILFWNKGAETIFGYTEDEVIGASIEILMPVHYRARHCAGFERFRATGRSHIIGKTVEFEGLRKNATVFPVELSLASWTNGQTTMLTAIIRDITERKRAEELQMEKEAAEEASRAKSSSLARISHELRTPLHAIVGFTNLLLQNSGGNLSAQDLDFLQRIRLNAEDQLKIINGILDLSKVEAGHMDVQIELVAIDEVVRDVTKQFETVRNFDRAGVELVLRLPYAVAPAPSDPHKLKQILMNLVDNALKFTKKGTVTVELIVDPSTTQPIRIDVIDTGVGMPPHRINEIFEPFRQIATDSSEHPGGTGLGLSICRSLCDLMGYTLDVHSEPGRGSTFSILLSQRSRLPLTA
jgi:PAS domain S-box-containing protein